MEGVISIEDFKIECTVGIYPFEKKEKQNVFIDLSLVTDFSRCLKTDAIADTINYDEVVNICNDIANIKHTQLLEKLAYDIVKTLFSKFDSLKAIKIKIKKPKAIPLARYAAVELAKTRDEIWEKF